MNNTNICPKCGTSVNEIFETGFVGCQECYNLPEVQKVIDKMYAGKTHKE